MRLLIFLFFLLLYSCGSPEKPLDAGTRRAIDSISVAQIRKARLEIDSLCKRDRQTLMPRLVDSIRQVRMREIERQLKTVPR
jgi:hypothetical protein